MMTPDAFHSELVSGCVSHRRREHHLHGDTDVNLRMARRRGRFRQWCNDHYRFRWRDFRNHDGSSK
ncbi:hypothetical protein OK016_00185 [Vibrio chagasii]|nr:hypothetical protein [Vibrio chagasii]